MMCLDHTPPKGAGKVHGITKTERLIKHIAGLGTDKHGNPIAIRAKALADATGIGPDSVSGLLATAVKAGRLVMCKITVPGTQAQNEYRAGPGVPPPDFKPLNPKRAGIALRGTPKPATAGPTPLSTPKPAAGEIITPTFITKTQPEVVAPTFAKTPAAGGAAHPPPAVPAVAAPATPKPAAGAVLKKEPATRTASAGDVRIGINDSGTLVIALDGDSMELDPQQAKRLGHFMVGTAGVWNPF